MPNDFEILVLPHTALLNRVAESRESTYFVAEVATGKTTPKTTSKNQCNVTQDKHYPYIGFSSSLFIPLNIHFQKLRSSILLSQVMERKFV